MATGQLAKKFLQADSVDGSKVRLANNEALKARNQADSANVNLWKANTTDQVEAGAEVNLAGFALKNLGAPVAASDAARKSDVDAVAAGLSWKDSVRVASTGNVALSGGASLSVDGVSLANGERVLLKDQTAGAENGIYVVSGIGTAYALTRALDADTGAEILQAAVFVEEGTANGDSGWVCITDGPITLDTTALSFTQFTGASSIVAGGGLTKTGNTLDVGAGDGIQVDADAVTVKLDGATLAKGAAGLKVAAAGITATELAAAVAGPGLDGGAGTALSLSMHKEKLTLSGTDITNGYKDLAFRAVDNSMFAMVKGGLPGVETDEYTLSLPASVTRLTFAGDWAAGGDAALVAGDVLVVQYAKF